MWIAGGSLERSWGSAKFGVFFFVMSAISALGIYVGAILSNAPMEIGGLLLPLAGVTVAFAMSNPEDVILFFFVIPLKLKYLALIDVAAVLIGFGQSHILIGLFALAGCAFSYWYVIKDRLNFNPVLRTERKGDVVHLFHKRSFLSYLNLIKLYANYRDRKRLKKLFDRSDFK
jgi:membrane associated rhomboid family serine protease